MVRPVHAWIYENLLSLYCILDRVRRDIMHRGRDVLQVLDQYERTVKPSFESYILPTKKHADIIVGQAASPSMCCNLRSCHAR